MTNPQLDWNEEEEGLEVEAADTLAWVAEADEAGERIDKALADRMDEGVSRSQVQLWIKDGRVTVQGRIVKANYKLAEGDRVEVTLPEPEPVELLPEPIPIEVVYEDSDVIVVNKPRGLVVHPAPGHMSGTLVNALLHHCQDLSGINGELRPGIVHRIDKDTSGLLMAAKNDLAHAGLSAQLKEHSATRKYIAIVDGIVQHDQGTVDAPIGRDRYDRKMFAVTPHNSKPSVTHFHVLRRFSRQTMLELKLETGRTHQIRVHMKFIGHPLVGDPMYGKAKRAAIQGQALHAATLGFTHPRTGERLEFEAPLPDDMKLLIRQLSDEAEGNTEDE